MNLLKTIKYQAKNPILKHLIKYFWVIQSNHPVIINHKLLPVGNIDIIMNFSPTIKYISDSKTEIVPKCFHFNGIRDRYYYINQTGKLNVFGISFFPTGLYPLLKIPLSEFTNQTIELDLLLNKFTSQIEEKLSITDSISEKFDLIEKELAGLIDIELIPKEITQIFNVFSSNTNHLDIHHFCDHYGINQRKLERIFNKYIGISPKKYLRLNRFQGVLNEIIKQKNKNLISLAYENDYYDQTHFIKDFKSLTGSSPSQFSNERKSVKEIIEYI